MPGSELVFAEAAILAAVAVVFVAMETCLMEGIVVGFGAGLDLELVASGQQAGTILSVVDTCRVSCSCFPLISCYLRCPSIMVPL